jgi:hypothetical protein
MLLRIAGPIKAIDQSFITKRLLQETRGNGAERNGRLERFLEKVASEIAQRAPARSTAVMRHWVMVGDDIDCSNTRAHLVRW